MNASNHIDANMYITLFSVASVFTLANALTHSATFLYVSFAAITSMLTLMWERQHAATFCHWFFNCLFSPQPIFFSPPTCYICLDVITTDRTLFSDAHRKIRGKWYKRWWLWCSERRLIRHLFYVDDDTVWPIIDVGPLVDDNDPEVTICRHCVGQRYFCSTCLKSWLVANDSGVATSKWLHFSCPLCRQRVFIGNKKL